MLDRQENLRRAVELINGRVGKVVAASSVLETEAWGFEAPPFLNQAVVAETSLSPEQTLAATQAIEREMGRTEKTTRDAQGNPVYHDRIIDIDILLFEGETRNTPTLTIPHPLIEQRDFVKIPLAEAMNNGQLIIDS